MNVPTTPIVVAKDGTGLSGEVAVSERDYEGNLFLVLDVGNGVEDGMAYLTPRDAAIVGAQLLQWAFEHGVGAADFSRQLAPPA